MLRFLEIPEMDFLTENSRLIFCYFPPNKTTHSRARLFPALQRICPCFLPAHLDPTHALPQCDYLFYVGRKSFSASLENCCKKVNAVWCDSPGYRRYAMPEGDAEMKFSRSSDSFENVSFHRWVENWGGPDIHGVCCRTTKSGTSLSADTTSGVETFVDSFEGRWFVWSAAAHECSNFRSGRCRSWHCKRRGL